MNAVFEELYEKYHNDLYQFLFYMVKNKEQTEDLVQDVYIKVMKSYNTFEGKSSEKTWLFSIARHTAIDYFRKQKSWRERILQSFDWTKQQNQLEDQHPLPEEITIQNEDVKRMYKCLDQCTEDQRAVLILRYIQSFSIAETASVLEWTESKVKTTQHRGMKRLKEVMDFELEKEGMISEKVNSK